MLINQNTKDTKIHFFTENGASIMDNLAVAESFSYYFTQIAQNMPVKLTTLQKR